MSSPNNDDAEEKFDVADKRDELIDSESDTNENPTIALGVEVLVSRFESLVDFNNVFCADVNTTLSWSHGGKADRERDDVGLLSMSISMFSEA